MMNIGFAGARPRAVQSSAPVEVQEDQVVANGGIVLDYVRENGETWRSYLFNASDAFTVYSKGTVRALLIGGAGGGGFNGSGGGGSGGLLMPTIELEPGSYSCVVGAGGTAGEYQDYAGKNGTPSSFRGYIAAAGGGGRGSGGSSKVQFKDGASGGGASADYELIPGLSIEYQGNDGGIAVYPNGAGGGGFASPGGDATANGPGIGGDGIAIEFGGYSIEVCAGAGGLGSNVVAPSGLGGPGTYGDGPVNSGSGGTGGNANFRPGNGASGLIIIEHRVY